MASRRRMTTPYSTYGSVAYAPVYDGSAVRVPRREEEEYQQPAEQPRRRERARRHALTRAQVQVREAGQVAPFAVVGFLAVAVFASLILLSCAQYISINRDVVRLRSQMDTLTTECATLSAQYEKVFDMAAIQKAVGDEMVRPTSDQVVYIDLSQPDTVTVYGDSKDGGTLEDTLHEIGDALGGLIEYFR